MSIPAISPMKLKLAAACFVGLHVPLVALAFYALATDFGNLIPVLIVTLIGTLVGVAGTLLALHYILAEGQAGDASFNEGDRGLNRA